jgi:hypothetical protein
MLVNQAREQITDKLSPGATDDVTDKKNLQNNSKTLKGPARAGNGEMA